MRVTFWGTRGSVATPGPETVRYGGNTACVEVRGEDGTLLVFDAGTGIRRLGVHIEPDIRRIDVLLTHLHLDHIIGLGFFAPLFRPGLEVHLWGPASSTMSLGRRLTRYLSPPLFPVHLRDLPCNLHLHEVGWEPFQIGALRIDCSYLIHPGPTVGYRVTSHAGTLAYMPDHEPSLGMRNFPPEPRWTSGFDIAEGVDLLIHDGQYNAHEYAQRVGWGHSTLDHTVRFARLVGAARLIPFHHDPIRDDDALEREIADVVQRLSPHFPVEPAAEGQTLVLGAQ